MKKILTGILTAVMLFALCACSETQLPEDNPHTNTAQTEESTQDKPTLSGEDKVIPGR